MALSGILKSYRARLRVRVVLIQELLAVVGLAVGVALLFSSQVAGTSLNHSVSQLSRDVVGNMQLQLRARGPRGFPAALLSEVRQIPGVLEAQPILEEQAVLVGPHGRKSVELLGAPPSFAHHLRELPGHLTAEQVAHQQELGLPAPVAAEIGASGSLQPVEIQVGTHVSSTLVGAVLEQRNIGELVHSPVAIAPIAYAQELSGTPGLLTRIFVRTARGREAQVRAALERLAAGRLAAAGGGGGGGRPPPSIRRARRLRRDAVRAGLVVDQSERRAVRGDQRAGGLPVRLRFDADHDGLAARLDRGTA